MYKYLNTLIMIFCVQIIFAQSGNYVSSGSESVNFGSISLTTSTSWSTDRSASPGYFSASAPNGVYTDASDAHNINGYVRHYPGTTGQGFTFPVGSGVDLRQVQTSGTIPNNISYSTAWIVGNPSTTSDPTDGGAFHPIANIGSGLSEVSAVGQWDWVANIGSTVGITVTVSIPSMVGFVGSAVNLRLVGWNGTQWVNLSGSTGASGLAENSTLSGTLITGITALGIGVTAPDLFPNFTFGNTSYLINNQRFIVININETKGINTRGNIQFFVPNLTGFQFNFDSSLTSATVSSSETVNNNQWSSTPTSTGLLFNTSSVISAGGRSRIALRVTALTAGSVANITVNIPSGSGGESNSSNNISVLSHSIQN